MKVAIKVTTEENGGKTCTVRISKPNKARPTKKEVVEAVEKAFKAVGAEFGRK